MDCGRQMSFYLSIKTISDLDKKAKKLGMNRSGLIRQMISDWLPSRSIKEEQLQKWYEELDVKERDIVLDFMSHILHVIEVQKSIMLKMGDSLARSNLTFDDVLAHGIKAPEGYVVVHRPKHKSRWLREVEAKMPLLRKRSLVRLEKSDE